MQLKVLIVVITFFTFLLVGTPHADVLKVERQIQLPTGKPAAGAKVLLRSLNAKDGTLKEEKRVVADEQGVVRAEIEIDPNDDMSPIRTTGYMMVDMPGMALVFESVNNWYRRRDVDPIYLGVGYELKGKVLTRQGEPVAGAEVALAAFASPWFNWRINYPSANIATHEVTTQTQADGSFELRPVRIQEQTFGNGEPVVRPLLIARATQGEVMLTGRSEFFARKVGAPPPTGNVPDNSIRVYPASTVRGRVLSAIDGQPVAGAQVVLLADPGDDVAASIRPATSGIDGTFEFVGVPASFQLFAEATHTNFAKGWTRIGEGRNRIAGDEPRRYDNVEIGVRPWVVTSGRVVDVVANAPPITPISVQAVYEGGYNDGRIAVGRGVAVGRMNPDGTFTMKMPMGYNHLLVRGPGYREDNREHPTDLNLPRGGQQDIVLNVQREKGFLVRFDMDDAAALNSSSLQIRGPDGKESSTNFGPIWHWPYVKDWGEKIHIRLVRMAGGHLQELLPWTEITADPQQWPQEFRLHADPRLSIRGRVVRADTGQPVSGATVTLLADSSTVTGSATPAKDAASKGATLMENVTPVKNVASITTDATGSFVLDKVQLLPRLYVAAQHPDLAAGRTQVYGSIPTAGPSPAEQAVDNAVIQLKAFTTIEGRVIEVETGQPPLLVRSSELDPSIKLYYGLDLLAPELSKNKDRDNKDQDKQPLSHESALSRESVLSRETALSEQRVLNHERGSGGAGLVRGTLEPDGSFKIKTTPGLSRIYLTIVGYELQENLVDRNWGQLAFEGAVPPDGLKDVVLRVKRNSTFVFRFDCDDPARLTGATVYIRTRAGEHETRLGSISAKNEKIWVWGGKWGNTIDVRLSKLQVGDILPWTTITCDPEQWPRVIKVP